MGQKTIEEITSMRDIQTLLLDGFSDWKQYGEVYTKIRDNLTLFSYLPTAAYEDRWNFFERVSRGLILDNKTGEIVARPFDKFFNWFQGGRKATGYFVTITEKIDGSLGILFRQNEKHLIATRGAFDSEQAIWATKFLNDNYDLIGLPNEYTLLFEILYPENRVVINYGDREDLVLLAVRNRFNGDYLPFYSNNYNCVYSVARKYGFSLPNTYRFNNAIEILEETGKLDANNEGFVVETSTGERWKFKGDRYLEVHRLISNLTPKNVLAAMLRGEIEEYKSIIPDEFIRLFNNICDSFIEKQNERIVSCNEYFHAAPKNTRKDFAIWVNKNVPKYLQKYMFLMLDEREIDKVILEDIGKNE